MHCKSKNIAVKLLLHYNNNNNDTITYPQERGDQANEFLHLTPDINIK